MNADIIKNKILICFKNIGVELEYFDETIPFSDVVNDSLTFISLMIEIENIFEKEVPPNYMTTDSFETLEDVYNMVCVMLDNNI